MIRIFLILILLAVGVLAGCTDSSTLPSDPRIVAVKGVFTELDATAGEHIPAMALDQNGDPAVAFPKAGGVGFAHRIGDAWSIETVEQCDRACQLVRLYFSPLGIPHVIHQELRHNEPADLRFLTKTQDGWTPEIVDNDGYLGMDTQLAWDSQGQMHFAYRVGQPYYDLRYAQKENETWEAITFTEEGSAGHDPLIYFVNGEPHILYWNFRDDDILFRVARRTPKGWQLSNADTRPRSPAGVRNIYQDRNSSIWFTEVQFDEGANESWLVFGEFDGALRVQSQIAGPLKGHGPAFCPLAIDSQGTAWVAYTSYFDPDTPIMIGRLTTGGTWDVMEIEGTGLGYVHRMNMIITPDDRMYLAFLHRPVRSEPLSQTMFGEVLVEYESVSSN